MLFKSLIFNVMKKAFFFAPFLHFCFLRAGWLVFLLIAFLPAYAQVGSPRNDWVVGVNAGVQMNKVLFQPNIRQTYLTAPTIGLTARYTSEKYFSMICAIQVELNYARLGWKEDIYSSQSVKLADTYERRIDYLQLPILANLGFGREQRGVKGFLLAGPQLGYALQEKELRSSTWTTRVLSGTTVPDRANNVFAQYDKPIEHRFDYGICAGLGMEVATKVGRFVLDARYYYGLADLFGNSKRDPFSRSPHNTISAKVSYLLDVKRKK